MSRIRVRTIAIGLAVGSSLCAENRITIDYPPEGAIFPPEIVAPTFLWRDLDDKAGLWAIEVIFSDGSPRLRLEVPGERPRIGNIDTRCIAATNQLPRLPRADQHSWKPDTEVWEQIKAHSREQPVTVAISGAPITFMTSRDPAGAPIFYRDVPLMPSELEKGVIKPLSPQAVPLIGWRLRYLNEPAGRLVMEGLHTCANCHSFSADGKVLGMDMDGPQNNKGMYALVPVTPRMAIRHRDVIAWPSFKEMQAGQVRVGFMSQVSPDGRYVATMVRGSMFVNNFKDYRFLQVFYPTRGILAWYNRATGQLRALPGADDPRYVHTNAVWSPDGKYLVFARAEAVEPYPPGAQLAEYAGDPKEIPMRYDLYRIPFNQGRGGAAEPVAGASANGMSNNFPKISPDGRWIVYVQCRNGQLMRPDSQLYIVPAGGGAARRMRANTPLMNSWHSFSPNGRWLVFSSKSRSPYTQMCLTHIDEDGNDSPAVLVEDSTDANRAINIPEFLNVPPEGLAHIDAPAVEFYRLQDLAWEFTMKGQYEEAVRVWEKAAELEPKDAKARTNLGAMLVKTGRLEEGLIQFRKALLLDPSSTEAHNDLAVALAQRGEFDEAILHFRRVLAADPGSAPTHANLARALGEKGRLDDAVAQFRESLRLDPSSAEVEDCLGRALAWQGRVREALPHYERALKLNPKLVSAHYNFGNALYYALGNIADALAHWRAALRIDPDQVVILNQTARVLASTPQFTLRNAGEALEYAQRAARLSGGQDPSVLDTLAAAYAEAGRYEEAVATARRARSAARQRGDYKVAAVLDVRVSLYETGKPYREPCPAGW